MNFFNNIFSSSYKYYAKFKNEVPLGSAVCVVCVSQITLALLLVACIGKLIGKNLFLFLPHKLYYLPIFILWLFMLFRYYSPARAEKILTEFNKKDKASRRMWALLSVISFIGPIIIFFIVLSIA
jgi:uncharacterized membrane protein